MKTGTSAATGAGTSPAATTCCSTASRCPSGRWASPPPTGPPVPEAGDLRGPVRRKVEANLAELARGDGAVILGRGAAVALVGHPHAFHVRLDGPPERRCEQAMALEGIDASTARDRMEETDRARAQYLARLYER